MINETLVNCEVAIQTTASRLKLNQPRRSTVTLLAKPKRNKQNARLLIVEKTYTPRPDQQWTPCGKTLHLTLKSNASHIQVIGYIRRDEIANNRQLGDLICLESEQLSAALEDAEDINTKR